MSKATDSPGETVFVGVLGKRAANYHTTPDCPMLDQSGEVTELDEVPRLPRPCSHCAGGVTSNDLERLGENNE